MQVFCQSDGLGAWSLPGRHPNRRSAGADSERPTRRPLHSRAGLIDLECFFERRDQGIGNLGGPGIRNGAAAGEVDNVGYAAFPAGSGSRRVELGCHSEIAARFRRIVHSHTAHLRRECPISVAQAKDIQCVVRPRRVLNDRTRSCTAKQPSRAGSWAKRGLPDLSGCTKLRGS